MTDDKKPIYVNNYSGQSNIVAEAERDTYMALVDLLKEQNASLRDSLKLAVEALGLYADISNWMGIDGCEFDLIDHDKKTQGHGSCGVKARMTLAEITAKHGEITKGEGN